MAGMVAFLLMVAVLRSDATPIRPDLKKVLAEPQPEATQFPLARAGWDGPEVQPSSRVAPNATLEQFGPAGSARQARASLIAVAMPDYRAVTGILLVILLLRRIRVTQRKARAAAQAATKSPVVALPTEPIAAPRDIDRAA